MSELIVVVRYLLHQNPIPKNETVARDTVYGLFTLIFLLLLVQLVGVLVPSATSNPVLLEKMNEDIRTHVRDTVDATIETNGGAQYTPLMGSILQAVVSKPGSGLMQTTRTELMDQEESEQRTLNGLLQEYAVQLQHRYGALI